eukprot:11117612-Karenia_brevis.AAC.1
MGADARSLAALAGRRRRPWGDEGTPKVDDIDKMAGDDLRASFTRLKEAGWVAEDVKLFRPSEGEPGKRARTYMKIDEIREHIKGACREYQSQRAASSSQQAGGLAPHQSQSAASSGEQAGGAASCQTQSVASNVAQAGGVAPHRTHSASLSGEQAGGVSPHQTQVASSNRRQAGGKAPHQSQSAAPSGEQAGG